MPRKKKTTKTTGKNKRPSKRKVETKSSTSKRLTKSKTVATDENLVSTLWDTIQGVRNGTFPPERALAISNASKEIMRVQRTKIDAAKLGLKKVKDTKLIG